MLILVGSGWVDSASAYVVSTCEHPNGQKDWTLTTLPVGHGDAHVLQSPQGELSVVDTASTETVTAVINFLEQQDISRIDRIVVTHPHWDHIGGTSRLVENFSVGTVLRAGLSHSTKVTRRTQRKLRKNGVPVRILSRGDTFSLGSGGRATVLNPGDTNSGGLNRNSLAFSAQIGRTSLLMMGDVIGSRVEKLLNRGLVREADILKVAHHGNRTGTSRRFLQTVNPSVAILPAPLRKNDPWGKPDPALIDRLQEFGIPTFQTGKVGAVKVTFDERALRTVQFGSTESCSSRGY